MKTLAAIEKQIAQLKKKADAIAQAAKSEAIQKARDLIERHGLSAEDLGLAGGRPGRKVAATSTKSVKAGAPRYRDPATGKTWTGVGRAPGWIADAKDRSKFLIEPTAGPQTEGASAPASKRGGKSVAAPTSKTKPKAAAKKAPRKAATKRAPAAKKSGPEVSANSAPAGQPGAGASEG